MVIFAEHNLIKDACFVKLDMLCCRNVLIYFTYELQKKLLPIFHYTLHPGGILFLGPSESIGENEDIFSTVDAKWKIFKRRETAAGYNKIIEFPSQAVILPKYPALPAARKKEEHKSVFLPEIITKILLENHTPPAVVINQKGDILYINGRTGKYMEPAPGQPQMNIYDMAREGLGIELRSAILRTKSGKEKVVVPKVKVKTNGHYQYVKLTILPLEQPDIVKDLLMVIFEDISEIKKRKGQARSMAPSEKDQLVQELENELRITKESLQQTIEETETSYEELKSTNEELQSTNEELQSTSEESNTAKEEMQAMNEELMTLNMELRSKTEELTGLNNDMTNLLNSSEVATVFVGNDLKIKRFTPRSTQIMNIIHSDIGRPVTDIRSNLQYTDLARDIKEVIDRLTTKELQLQDKTGKWYVMRIIPYRTQDNFIDGAVITIFEITPLKQMEFELKAALDFAEGIVETVRNPLVVLDSALRVISMNQAFSTTFNISRPLAMGKVFYHISNDLWNIPQVHNLLDNLLAVHMEITDYQVANNFSGGNNEEWLFTVRKLLQPQLNKSLILLSIDKVK
jgi:two-component system CheB/CheR fusion protein